MTGEKYRLKLLWMACSDFYKRVNSKITGAELYEE